jgi:NTE family protein
MVSGKRRIGFALGSGSARGWAHIGVIRALEAAGIRPNLVAGTSIGALVGAAYALGKLDELEAWVRALRARDVVGFLDIGVGSGLIKGERLMAALHADSGDRTIEELSTPFGAVSTDLRTGEEIWLRSGATLDAVRASIALPGLFPPVEREGRLLVDGGLVNPVPISLARAMGAEIVIAVDLSSDMLGSRLRRHANDEAHASPIADWKKAHGVASPQVRNFRALPSPLDVFVSSMQVMQVRIARSRIAEDPPNLLVAPRVSQLALLDFHRASEAIEEGRHAVERVAAQLQELVAGGFGNG